MAIRMAGIRKMEPIRKPIGSPRNTALLDVDALDARSRLRGAGRRRRAAGAGRTHGWRLGLRAPRSHLVLVDQEHRGQELLLGGQQVTLSLRWDHVAKDAAHLLAQLAGQLDQAVGVAGHPAPHLPNRTRSSPASMAAPSVLRDASTLGSATSRR